MNVHDMQYRDRSELVSSEGRLDLSFFQKLKLKFFIAKVKRYPLGGTKWQLMQEKVSLLPDWGYYARKRAAFYMATMNCGNSFYAHTGVAMLYPKNIVIGENVTINRYSIITAKDKVDIGNNVLIGSNVIINSGNHNYINLDIPINQQGHTIAPITIEDDVWIGSNVCILAGVTIGQGSVIGAGAVVTKNVEPYSVMGGVPARLIKSRK